MNECAFCWRRGYFQFVYERLDTHATIAFEVCPVCYPQFIHSAQYTPDALHRVLLGLFTTGIRHAG